MEISVISCGAVVGGRGPPRLGHGEPASPVHLQRRPRRSNGGWNFILVLARGGLPCFSFLQLVFSLIYASVNQLTLLRVDARANVVCDSYVIDTPPSDPRFVWRMYF